jgi:hypothetical protein
VNSILFAWSAREKKRWRFTKFSSTDLRPLSNDFFPVTDEQIKVLAAQLMKALGPPLASLIQQNTASLIKAIRAQQRVGRPITRREFHMLFGRALPNNTNPQSQHL